MNTFADNMAFTFQTTAIPATLIVHIWCDKFKEQQSIVIFTCLLYLSGMILFLFTQSQITKFIALLLLALGMGGSISLSIAFISLRNPNAKITSELSGMPQSVGHLLAAIVFIQ